MTSRSRGHDMTITINKKKCKAESGHTSQTVKLSFLNSSLKINNLKNLGFLASFTALIIVWQI